VSADALLMETLLRVEHKIDLLLKRLPAEDGDDLLKVGSVNHSCPLCTQPVSYNVDINDSVVIRKCGCSTGKIALDLKAFAPPVNPARKTDNGGRDDEQEDRSDSSSVKRGSQWR
jgi:hypothetical protein